jgi:hypothetical protein
MIQGQQLTLQMMSVHTPAHDALHMNLHASRSTTKGATNCVNLNQLDASQRPKVPMVTEFSDVLPEELSVVPPD